MASAHRKKSPSKRRRSGSTSRGKRWSGHVTQHSHALDLERGVFTRGSASNIARSLKRSADRSRRRKTDPFRSAMSMLNFYISRAGSQLPERRKRTPTRAKTELRSLYGKAPAGR